MAVHAQRGAASTVAAFRALDTDWGEAVRPLTGERATVDALLEEWARWVKEGVAHLGWPRVTLLARVADQGFTGASQTGQMIEMPDGILLVERAVCALKAIERKVLCKHYLYWQPVEASARYCHMSPNRFRVLLHRARNGVSVRVGTGALLRRDQLHPQSLARVTVMQPKGRAFVRGRPLAV